MTRGAVPDRSEKTQVERPTEDSGEVRAPERPLPLKLVPEVLLLAISIYLFIDAFGFEYVAREGRLGPSFWPQAICVGIALCSVAAIAHKILGHGRLVAQEEPSTLDVTTDVAEEESVIYWPRVALAIGLVIAYPLSSVFIGYPLATALLLITFLYLGGQRKWYIVPIGIFSSLIFTYVFSGFVYISIPWGVGIFEILTGLIHQMLGIY
jgi:putative tricarboxylic transport membrane protein